MILLTLFQQPVQKFLPLSGGFKEHFPQGVNLLLLELDKDRLGFLTQNENLLLEHLALLPKGLSLEMKVGKLVFEVVVLVDHICIFML